MPVPSSRPGEGLRVLVLTRAVAPLHGHGGMERHVRDLARHLDRLGVQLFWVVPPPLPAEGVLPGRFQGLRYRFLPLPRGRVIERLLHYPLWSLRAGRRALELARREGIHVVHAHGYAAWGYARLRRPGDPPLVLNPHGLEEFQARGWKGRAYLPFRAMLRDAARRSAAVIATDRRLEPMIEAFLRVPRERIALLPNAVDLEELDRPGEPLPADLEAFCRDRTPLLLSVGRLEPNKGFDRFLEALARAPLPSGWGWVLVGTGSQAGRLEARSRALGLEGRVRLAGALSDGALRTLRTRADLFVHPTLYEGSALVVLEAMAARLPVLATTAGGIPDKVVDGETGLLVPPGDVEALAAGLARLLALRDRWPEMGARGRARVEAAFTWSRVARDTVALYRRLVEA